MQQRRAKLAEVGANSFKNVANRGCVGEDQLPLFIAAGTFRWQEMRRIYERTAAAQNATGQAESI